MTKTMRPSELLTRVYSALETEDSGYSALKSPWVCVAIGLVTQAEMASIGDDPVLLSQLNKAESIINALIKKELEGHTFYTKLLESRGVPLEHIYGQWTQLRRREWVCMMISQLEREGL